ncbi:MAG: hypothetical protein GX612_06245 [Bacteroidales bacterium]|nr:hypothetical protein [Bacteroidales bacterium]
MELDDIKNTWASYDEKLNKSLKLNEELLRKLNLDKSKREMKGPFYYETTSLIMTGLLIIVISGYTYRYGSEIVYLVSGLLSILFCLTEFVFSFQKLKILTRIDYYNMSVIDLQKNVLTFKNKYLQFKKIELTYTPLFVVSLIPILGKGLRGFDFFSYYTLYIFITIIVLIIAYPILIWIYKNLYDKKLKNTMQFLKELEVFEKNES